MTTDIQSSVTIDRNRLLAFDLETTGPDPRTAHVVTSALLAVDGARKQDQSWLADPGIEIPAGATEVHGITTEHARANGRPHAEVIAETVEGIRAGWREGRALVVFNASFDLTILRRWDPSFEVTGPVVDPFVIDWGETGSPARTIAPTLTLESFEVSHPEPERIRTQLRALGTDIEVGEGPAGVRLTLSGPGGSLTL